MDIKSKSNSFDNLFYEYRYAQQSLEGSVIMLETVGLQIREGIFFDHPILFYLPPIFRIVGGLWYSPKAEMFKVAQILCESACLNEGFAGNARKVRTIIADFAFLNYGHALSQAVGRYG
jgi:hypothetical protein